MSETVSYKGKLKSTGLTLEKFMKNINFPSHYDKNVIEDVEEYFYDEFYDKKVLINNIVCDFTRKELQNECIFEAKILENGEIEFLVQYYNGCCSFAEAIEEALEQANDKS